MANAVKVNALVTEDEDRAEEADTAMMHTLSSADDKEDAERNLA